MFTGTPPTGEEMTLRLIELLNIQHGVKRICKIEREEKYERNITK